MPICIKSFMMKSVAESERVIMSPLNKMFYISILVLILQGLLACQHDGEHTETSVPQKMDKPVLTDNWAIRLQTGTDPRALAQDYGAVFLGSIGSLSDTWLIQRPGFDLPGDHDPMRQDSRILWIERQIKQKMHHRPAKSDKSYIK